MQRLLDEAFNSLEWDPIPVDVLALDPDAHVYAVRRSGTWIVYEVDEMERALVAWALVLAP